MKKFWFINFVCGFVSLEKSVENLTEQNSELDTCNIELTVQNKSLARENEKLRHQCEKAMQKLLKKSQLLAYFGTLNFNKRERQKEKKFKSRIFFERM